VEHRESIRVHNYRSFFLKSIEKCTPEVVEDLARDILPHYSAEFWAECEKDGQSTLRKFDNHVKYHNRYAHAWFSSSDDYWWERYATVRNPLLNWAKRYRIFAEWVLKMALDAMLEWTWHFTRFDKFESVLPWEVIAERAKRMTPEMRPQY